MLTKKFLKQIESYIVRHFKNHKKFNERRKELILKGHLHIHYVPKEKLEERLRQFKKTFPQYLLNFITEHEINEVDICKKVHLDRRIFFKLRNQQDYMPRKRTILKIAFAMELELSKIHKLLYRAGYSLSDISKKDIIVKFFFENRIYDLTLLNEVLNHYDFKTFN